MISGASSGIGKAAAIHLASNGWRVFAGVLNDVEAAELASNASLEPIVLDVTR